MASITIIPKSGTSSLTAEAKARAAYDAEERARALAAEAALATSISTEIANIIDSAPGALDTLNELAAALGDDPNFSATVLANSSNNATAITAETTRATAAEAANAANIATNTSALSTLTANAPALLDTLDELAAAIGDDKNFIDRVTANTTSISANTTAITAETTRATAAEAALAISITTEVANLIDSAPGALDTLNELAAAIGDDANFITTINNSITTNTAAITTNTTDIASKLPLSGGTIAGNLEVTGVVSITSENALVLPGNILLTFDMGADLSNAPDYIMDAGTGLEATGSIIDCGIFDQRRLF